MKTLLITLLTLLTLNLSAQKLQVTGLVNIDAQWNQLTKTNDSLKTILKSCQADNYFLTQQYYKMAAQIKAQKKSIDSLQVIILNIKAKQFIDSIEFIGFNDTISGTFTKLTEKMILIDEKDIIETRCESDHIAIIVKSFENVDHISTDKSKCRSEKLEIWGNFIVELLSHQVIEKHKLTADEKKDLSIFTKNSLIKFL